MPETQIANHPHRPHHLAPSLPVDITPNHNLTTLDTESVNNADLSNSNGDLDPSKLRPQL